jgi:hypothetical protein
MKPFELSRFSENSGKKQSDNNNGATTLSITTLSITKNKLRHTQHNGTCAVMLSVSNMHFMLSVIMLIVVMLNVVYADCRYAEYRGAIPLSRTSIHSSMLLLTGAWLDKG